MKEKIKILAATDFSDKGTNAERYAVQLADSMTSDLTFIHVYEPPILATEPLEVLQAEQYLEKIQKSELTQRINMLLHSVIHTNKNISVHSLLKEGNSVNQILQYSEENCSDFILLGAHGNHGIGDKIFGGTAWHIINKSKTPVLVIPENAFFRGWKQIVYAVEYSGREIPVINYLANLAKTMNSELTLLHVTHFDFSKEYEKAMFLKFKKSISNKFVNQKITFRLIKDHDIDSGLIRYCTDKSVDLLVVSPEQKSLFERIFGSQKNIAKKLIFHTSIPLLTIPDFYNGLNEDFWKKYIRDFDSIHEEF